MICKPCAVAADAQTLLIDNDTEKWTDTQPIDSPAGALRFIAHSLHRTCKGESHCDCQHKLVEPGKNVAKHRADL